MAEMKSDQNHRLKETNEGCYKGQIHETVSNGQPIQHGEFEEQRAGRPSDPDNSTKILAACNKRMSFISGKILERGDSSKDSGLPKNDVDKSKSEIISTLSSNLSPILSQGFVRTNPSILKYNVDSISNLERTEPNIASNKKKINPPHNIKTFNTAHVQEVKTYITENIPAVLGGHTSPVEDNNISSNNDITSAPACGKSSILSIGSTSTITTATTHGFRYKDAVGTQNPPASKLQTDLSPQSIHLLEANSSKKPKDSCLTESFSTVRKGQLATHVQCAPVKLSATRPRSNSVPNYTDKNQVSSESEYASSETLGSLRCVVGRIPSLSQPVSKTGLRRGKWTTEEEAYVARVIQDFNSGYLDAPAGTTLRTFLSDKLNCDPMRITKKFTGDACIGKRVFHPAIRCPMNATTINKAQNELKYLEGLWRRRIEIQRRESEKKQAASVAAAAAAAAVSGRLHLNGHIPNRSTLTETIHQRSIRTSSNDLAQTASWLDRANALLSNTQDTKEQLMMKIPHGDSVEKEMEEVQRLIHEGPVIQKTSAGFTMLFESGFNNLPPTTSIPKTSNNSTSKQKVSDDQYGKSISNSNVVLSRERLGLQNKLAKTGYASAMSCSNNASVSILHDISKAAPASKRLRKSYSTSNLELVAPSVHTGTAEDAATLMGFLSSVRQSAASSGKSLK